jgi:uncharacterized membrane protein
MYTINNKDGSLSFSSDEHKSYFKKEIDQEISLADLDGKNKNLHNRSDHPPSESIGWKRLLKSRFDRLMVENHDRIETNLSMVRSWLYNIKAELGDVLRSQNGLEIKPGALEQSHVKPSYFKLLISGILILITMSSEWALMSASLQVVASNIIAAILMAAGLSTGIAIIVHFTDNLLKLITSPLWRRMVASAIFFLILFIMIGLGTWRSQYMEAHGMKGGGTVWFVVINIFFVFVLFLIFRFLVQPALQQLQASTNAVRHTSPSLDLREARKRAKELTTERDKVEGLESELDTLALMTERQISAGYDVAFAAQLAFHPSVEEEEPLPLTFYYINSKTEKHDQKTA